jgi:hypothetical protein
MIALGKWFIEEGFMVLENESRVMLARRISHYEVDALREKNWALLRLSKLPDGIQSEWKLLRTYSSQDAAQSALGDIESCMWAEGFETEPSCAQNSTFADYEDVPGYGAF